MRRGERRKSYKRSRSRRICPSWTKPHAGVAVGQRCSFDTPFSHRAGWKLKCAQLLEFILLGVILEIIGAIIRSRQPIGKKSRGTGDNSPYAQKPDEAKACPERRRVSCPVLYRRWGGQPPHRPELARF